MNATTHAQAAPATAYALTILRNLRLFEGPDGSFEPLSLVYLTVAAAADRDLYGPNGYNGHTADDVAALLDISEDEATALLDCILNLQIGYLDLNPGGLYRIPQIAYDRSNGEA